MSSSVSEALQAFDLPGIAEITPLSGGCINQCFRLLLDDHSHRFFKYHRHPPPGFFAAEAAGLNALRTTDGLRIPEVIAVSEQGLLLEYLQPEPVDTRGWRRLGEGLAQLHRNRTDRFGFFRDNFCGLTLQPNPWYTDGFDFFGEQRLGYQADLAAKRGRLPSADVEAIDYIANHLRDWLPEQAPVLIHGDLWSGNHYGYRGQPVLVDPAVYWGWAEAEIAMTRLFGGFPPAFYESYSHNHPLEPGWLQRMDLYNLYPLLNHLNLFGSAYLEQIRQITHRYHRCHK